MVKKELKESVLDKLIGDAPDRNLVQTFLGLTEEIKPISVIDGKHGARLTESHNGGSFVSRTQYGFGDFTKVVRGTHGNIQARQFCDRWIAAGKGTVVFIPKA